MERGKLLFDQPKLVFIAGPAILLVCLGIVIYDLFMGYYLYILLFMVVFLATLTWFIYGIRTNRESVWENCAAVLDFPNPVPKTVWFQDLRAIYPLYTYSPKTRKLLTSRLCLLDSKGQLLQFRDHTAVLTLAMALTKQWKLYDGDYDIKHITRGEMSRMRMLLGFSNALARVLKFISALAAGMAAYAFTYLVLGWGLWPGAIAAGVVAMLLGYFGSIFAIGAILIEREDVKRRISMMKEAGLLKGLDMGIVKAYMSSPPPPFDGKYDLFDELVSQMGKVKGRPRPKPAKAAGKGPKAKMPSGPSPHASEDKGAKKRGPKQVGKGKGHRTG